MKDSGKPASNHQCHQISAADLPLCCPLPGYRLWDAHPRVYLPIEQSGHETCPYCGAEYTLSK